MKLKTKWMTLCCLLQMGCVSAYAQGFGEKQLVNEAWRFHLGDVRYAGTEFHDDSSWKTLDIPHDWSVESMASPGNASCTGFLPGGIGWYRKNLEIPASKKGEKVYIYFEGVYNHSEVFINGKSVGKRPNGYMSFMYDLTPYINFGERNVIAVKVDHSEFADSRWYTGSGIYRDVYLVYANPIHINQWGVSYTSKIESQKKATLAIKTEIQNTENKNATVKVSHEVYTKEGKRVGSTSYSQAVGAEDVAETQRSISISNPILWDLDNPYMYTIKTVVSLNGKEIDRAETKAGIRSLTFDPNKGFALNGQSMKLKGACIHHDAACLGAAVPREVWKRRLLTLKEIGCNAVRMSHNPQAPCVYELCDEIGLMVQDEAFDEWEHPKNKWIKGWNQGVPGLQGTASYFTEWSKRDLADMVRRDRNHPSVIMWSIGNEIDYPNDPYSHEVLAHDDIGQPHIFGFRKDHPYATRLGEIAKDLVAVVKKHDTSRPTTAALAGAIMSNQTEYPGALDVVGYNYTERRYAVDHKAYPNRVLYGSENGHGFDNWKAVLDNENICGQFLWTAIDYLGEAGSWPSRGSGAGMVDYAGYIKPKGYYRQALWSETPMAYIGTQRIDKNNPTWVNTEAPAVWKYENGETIRVVTYTNCESAELYLNGRKVGNRKQVENQNALLYWDIPYAEGELEVKAFNKEELAASKKLETCGTSYAIKASLDKTKGIQKNEYLHLDIQVVDKDGKLVNLAEEQISCQVTGNAQLVGLENADFNVADNYRDGVQRSRNGRLLGYVKATANSGEIQIHLTSPQLKSETITVNF